MELILKKLVIDLLADLKVEEASVKVRCESVVKDDVLEHYQVEIKTNNPALLIGRHGETLKALQHILRIIFTKQALELNRNIRLRIDIDGYLAQKEQEALDLALRLAEKVRETAKPVKLPIMPSSLRRKIHLKFQEPEWRDLTTESSGVLSSRAVLIKKAAKEAEGEGQENW